MASWNFSSSLEVNEDEDEQQNLHDARGLKDHLLLIVDCSEEMWNDDACNPIEVLKTIGDVYKTKAASSSKDCVSLMLYGTRKTCTETNQPHVALLSPLEVPRAEDILRLMEIINSGKENFIANYGFISSAFLKMSDVLWEAQKIFSHKKYAGMSRVLLFTNNDNPHGISSDIEKKRREALTHRVRDLINQGVYLEVFGLSSFKRQFDYNLYYSKVLPLLNDFGDRMFGSYRDAVELSKALRKKKFGKRAQSKLLFSLTNDLKLGISLYALFVETKKPPSSYKDAKTLQTVSPQTKWIRADNGNLILGNSTSSADTSEIPAENQDSAVELVSSFKYSKSHILFSFPEIYEMKNICQTGLRLLCTKHRSEMDVFANIKPSYFIYPEENLKLGSTKIFSAFLFSLYKSQKIALCTLNPRVGSLVRLVALFPQLEIKDSNGNQEKHPGFHVIVMPYADDFRQLKLQGEFSEQNALVQSDFSEIISKLKFKEEFHPLRYPNPVLQKHNSVIEALALDMEEPSPWIDSLQPPVGRMNICSEIFLKICKNFNPLAESHASKKRKVDEEFVKDSDIDSIWKKRIEDCTINKQTRAELKKFLQVHCIAPKDRKADLIEQVRDYFFQE